MPTPEPTLSERLLEHRAWWPGEEMPEWNPQIDADLEEAAAKLARYEAAEAQPEVAKLLAAAEFREGRASVLHHKEARWAEDLLNWAADIRAHAATLVDLADARAKLARVGELCEATRERTATRENCRSLLRELKAALQGEKTEVRE